MFNFPSFGLPDRPPRVVPGLGEAVVAALLSALQLQQLILVQLVLSLVAAVCGGVAVRLAAVAGN